MREAVGFTQRHVSKFGFKNLMQSKVHVEASQPSKEIYDFKGTLVSPAGEFEPLRLKHTLWANTSVAAGEAIGLVIFVGKETRMQMNGREAAIKHGKTDREINRLSVFLFCFVLFMAALLLLLSGKFFVDDQWYIFFFRCVLLLSSVIPISLRVNVDLAKIVYSVQISKDERLADTVVRNSSIPEELGRVEYLLSDKTGTLTKNEMVFKRLSTVLANFSKENISTLKEFVAKDIAHRGSISSPGKKANSKKGKYDLIRELVTALMLCNNVMPTEDFGER